MLSKLLSSQDICEDVAYVGFSIVIIGVALEIVDVIAKWRKEHRNVSILVKDHGALIWVEAASIIFIVIGLSVEFIGGWKATLLARQKTDGLEQAAMNAQIALSSNAREIASLNSSNLVLQIELATAQKPRMIPKKEREDFISLARRFPHVSIDVRIGLIDAETLRYAHVIRKMLDDAGYASTNGPAKDGIIVNPTDYISTTNDDDATPDEFGCIEVIKNDLTFQIIFMGTNGFIPPLDRIMLIRPNKELAIKKGDSVAAAFLLFQALAQANVNAVFNTNDIPTLPKGTAAIYVPTRFE